MAWTTTLAGVTVKSPKKYDKYSQALELREVSSQKHFMGLEVKTYAAVLDDGDAIRFFYDLKEKRKQNLGDPAVDYLDVPYKLSVVLALLGELSDQEIEAIMDKYNETGDKRGIRINAEQHLGSSPQGTFSTWKYEMYLNRNDDKVASTFITSKYWD